MKSIVAGNIPDDILGVFFPFVHVIVIHELSVADGYAENIRREDLVPNCLEVLLHLGDQFIGDALQRIFVRDNTQVFLEEILQGIFNFLQVNFHIV